MTQFNRANSRLPPEEMSQAHPLLIRFRDLGHGRPGPRRQDAREAHCYQSPKLLGRCLPRPALPFSARCYALGLCPTRPELLPPPTLPLPSRFHTLFPCPHHLVYSNGSCGGSLAAGLAASSGDVDAGQFLRGISGRSGADEILAAIGRHGARACRATAGLREKQQQQCEAEAEEERCGARTCCGDFLGTAGRHRNCALQVPTTSHGYLLPAPGNETTFLLAGGLFRGGSRRGGVAGGLELDTSGISSLYMHFELEVLVVLVLSISVPQPVDCDE